MLRRLCNVAYAMVREGRTDEQIAALDLLLAEGPDALHAKQSREAQQQLIRTMGVRVPAP